MSSLLSLCPICKSRAKYELQKDGCDYFKCTNCSFLFHRRGYGASRLNHNIVKHYDDSYWENEQKEARRRETEDALNRALELIYLSGIPVRKILDFGCGFGMTVQKLRDYFGLEAIGVDPYGQFEENSYLHKKDLSEIRKLYDENYFDAIYSIEVFEHLEDPVAVFEHLNYLLKPNGMILINTFTIEAIELYDPDKSYIDPLVRGHISIWGLKSLKQLGKMFGYNVSFMAARKHAILLTKGDEGKPSASENHDLFRKIGPWYPQLMAEYIRLLRVEENFESKLYYIRKLKSMLNIK